MDGILAAKYQYVLTHKDRTDLNTYDFLVELKNANYKDAKKIYSSLYTYTFKAWYDKKDIWGIQIVLQGGPPKGSIPIRVKNVGSWRYGTYTSQNIVATDEIIELYPSKETQSIGVRLWGAYKHVITFYDADSGKQLAQVVVYC